MIKFLELALAIIAIGGVGGVGNQFFVLIILGFASRGGYLQIPAEFGFMQSLIFLVPVTIYWLITLLAELGLTPTFVLSISRQITKHLNTSLAPAFGGLVALLSVGFITHSSEQFRDVSSIILLLSPSELLTTDTSFGLFVAILAGTVGAAILSFLFSILSYAVKVTLYEENGGNKIFPPLFDNGSVLFILSAIYFLKDVDSRVIAACLVGFLALLITFVFRFSRQVFAVVDHVVKKPKDGLWLILDFFVWGRGGAMVGDPRASKRTKRLVFLGILYVGFNIGFLMVPIVGWLLEFMFQPLAVFVYLYCSRQSARTLWKFLKLRQSRSIEYQPASLLR